MPSAAPATRCSTRATSSAAVSSAATSTLIVSHPSPARRASEISGTTSDAGAYPAQRGLCPPSDANANPPSATRPEPGGPVGVSATDRATRSRHARSTAAKRPGPRACSERTQPSAAKADPSRSGCSVQNQSSPGRRDAAMIAVGSAASGERAVTLTSVTDPADRARLSPAISRRSSRARDAASSAGWPTVGSGRGLCDGLDPSRIAKSPRGRGRSRSRRCAPSRRGRTAARAPRTRRPCHKFP